MAVSGGFLASTVITLAVGFVPFLGVNYFREGSLEGALERTIDGAVGIVASIVGVVVMIVGGVWSALLVAPDVVISSILGVVGYLSLGDILSLTPESWGVLVIIGVSAIAYTRGR